MSRAARRSFSRRPSAMLLPLAVRIWLWMILSEFPALAQKRGPVQLYIVNDTEESISIVWLNNLRLENDELIPETTGPILPGVIASYRAYPNNELELHQADDSCGTKKGMEYKPEGQCPSAFTYVKDKGYGGKPTNIIVLGPNFFATTESVSNPSFLLKAMRKGVSINAEIQIVNQSQRDVELFWVNPQDKSQIPMSEAPLESRDNPYYFSASMYHQFVIKGGEGEDCQMRYFRVTGREVVITIPPDFDLDMKHLPYDPLSKFTYTPGIDLYQQCHDHIRPELGFENPEIIQSTIETCVRSHWDQVDWGFDANQQSYIDFKMEHYLCDDPRVRTSSAVEIELWRSESDPRVRTVFVLHEDESSQIHVISNFVTAEECHAIDQVTEGNFEATKTSDGRGGTRPNQIRKAQIARVDVPWSEPDNPITQLGRKIFDYVHHIHPSLEITYEGQEPLMAIQYNGRGRDDPYPDQYKSHCDSDCSGQPVREGQRVATMVVYCAMPEEGGHTNFRNAHVHIRPQPGNAVFFSYINEATGEQDDGKTIHAGCPVYEGTKKIVTQWIRYGVDYENPYTDYRL